MGLQHDDSESQGGGNSASLAAHNAAPVPASGAEDEIQKEKIKAAARELGFEVSDNCLLESHQGRTPMEHWIRSGT
ncbi:hypothetical protein K432DRAFT_401944 [Lepidopterella palustris CBS 459.81]|uniref:Uncharacterized protein n=1 Tax=Lepidopterella palustris CBS 459.81 TaxID=1314670 RepID=A0A8E2JII7_9PEZI|nr:hypothetical protein K432DRAFT_401944 [Lepidopterella palustris CBS 459.81]